MMMQSNTPAVPVVLQGMRGNLVGFYYPPLSTAAFKGNVLAVPAFAEEMNRCRAMVSLQARSLSAAGVGTLVIDLYGTGDSAGEFSDATWEIWRDDLDRALAWLRRNAGGCDTLLGVRLGAIMAAQIALADRDIRRLMLWQPVTQGKNYWTSFLRIRIAAEMDMKDGAKSTDVLRQQSAQGLVVEVSGYPVGGALAQRLDELVLPAASELAHLQVGWFEVLASAEAVPPRASSKAIEGLQATGASVQSSQVIGPPFWQVHERELAPALIEATRTWVDSWTALGHDCPFLPSASPAAVQDCIPIAFPCGEALLSGVVHGGAKRTGVIIVVAGGPQFRVGAHRQFVSLARKLAGQGYPVMRFDLRGMGDSSGEYVGFQHSVPDIRAAIDAFTRQVPHVDNVALFGECESASGILFYAFRDTRVARIALVNPWVRTQEGQAEVILKHYYRDRLFSRKFWRDVSQGKVNPFKSLSSFVDVLRHYLRGRSANKKLSEAAALENFDKLSLPVKTAEGLRRFSGPTLILMSGRDYIAREFDEVTRSSKAWEGLLSQPHVTRHDIADADHTFSKAAWKTEAQNTLIHWLKEA